jgi:hypothetical protein
LNVHNVAALAGTAMITYLIATTPEQQHTPPKRLGEIFPGKLAD